MDLPFGFNSDVNNKNRLIKRAVYFLYATAHKPLAINSNLWYNE